MDSNTNKIRLLLVDDEEEFLTSSSQALSRRGFTVEIALNGVTALDMVEKNNYDAIVLDVKMPDIDGIEVFRQIHDRQSNLPVILLTGHSSFDDAFRTSRDGVADYISKPIDMDELADRLKRIIKRGREQNGDTSLETGSFEFDDIIKVILIDDEVDFLEAMQKVLQRRNMEITTAESGEKALQEIRGNLVDVAVLDVKMPGMDGLEVLRRIKQEFPAIEVILLTGHPSVEAAIEGIRLGASEYLKKPPEVDDLAATIRKLYKNHQQAILEQKKKLIEEIRRRFPD